MNSTTVKQFVEIREFSLEEEFKKPTGITPKDVAEFRQWLSKQPHLPSECLSDLDLVLAYHCCDRSTEVAKQTLDLHYTLKTLFTTLFKDRIFTPAVEICMQKVLYAPLPMRSKEGYAILYVQMLDLNLQNYTPLEYIRLLTMVIDLWQHEEGTWPGFVMVNNMAGLTISHVAKLQLEWMQQLSYFFQEAILFKLKSVVLINSPTVVDKILMMVKPFIKNSLLQKIHVCQGTQGADEFFPIEALPMEAGGNHISLEECKQEMIEKFRANQAFFEIENKKKVNESKRPGKPKSISDIFEGTEGSFKKLEID